MTRDKVLVLFNNIEDFNLKQSIIKQIFGVDYSSTILKGLYWKTKYYEVPYDIYIDNCQDLAEWLEDFSDSSCDELREVLGGVIIIDHKNRSPNPDLIQQLERLCNHILTEDTFCVFFNHNEELSDFELESFEDITVELAANGRVVPEIVCLRSPNEGDRAGIDRVKEIMDIHPWDALKYISETDTTQARNDPGTTNLGTLMEYLDEAKSQVQRLREAGDTKAAEQLARETANKFTNQLFD